MATTFNALEARQLLGQISRTGFYAFTYDDDLNHVRADANIVSFSWTTSIRTSATTFFNIAGSKVQLLFDFFDGGGNDDLIYGRTRTTPFYNSGVISENLVAFAIGRMELNGERWYH